MGLLVVSTSVTSSGMASQLQLKYHRSECKATITSSDRVLHHHKTLLRYAYLLLAIVASIGHTLHHSLSVPLLSITHRSYAVFTQNPLLSGAYPGTLPHQLYTYHTYIRYFSAVIDACDISTIQAMFNDSFFILPSMLPTWEAALHCYELGRWEQVCRVHSIKAINCIYFGSTQLFTCLKLIDTVITCAWHYHHLSIH